MKQRVLAIFGASSLLVACGPPSPPALAYGVPSTTEVVYDFADTTYVVVSVMGQSLEMSQAGVARYAIDFSPAPRGVSVSLSVEALAATINQPMGAPLRIDENDVEGMLVFTLDRRGSSTVSREPEVQPQASLMVSGMSIAHTFFPRLPGRAVVAGEEWVDTVSFEGREGAGGRRETSVLRYTVVGDTVVSGRPLLVISLRGTTQSANDMSVSGMNVSQSSELEVQGRILWDYQRGMMVESVKRATGRGTASVPIAPAPLPITIESTQRARLRERQPR
jgi:hypothetical protein